MDKISSQHELCRAKHRIKIKGYLSAEGEYKQTSIAIADRPIFAEPNAIFTDEDGQPYERGSYKRSDTIIDGESALDMQTEYMSAAADDKLRHHEEENLRRAMSRAKTHIFDTVCAEYDFRYFVTLTLRPDLEFSRSDTAAACKKLNAYLHNRVQRSGLKYLIVPELHKNGAIHFHGVINDALCLVDSGTVIAEGHKKPIKRETAQRLGLDLAECKTVYNIPDWGYGFTTAIPLDDRREAVAAYISKYVTKDTKKIGGRYYCHSQNCRQPIVTFEDNAEKYSDKEMREYITPQCVINYVQLNAENAQSPNNGTA